MWRSHASSEDRPVVIVLPENDSMSRWISGWPFPLLGSLEPPPPHPTRPWLSWAGRYQVCLGAVQTYLPIPGTDPAVWPWQNRKGGCCAAPTGTDRNVLLMENKEAPGATVTIVSHVPELDFWAHRPRDGILHQTASRPPVANQVFLGSWTVDICQEGHSQRSVP